MATPPSHSPTASSTSLRLLQKGSRENQLEQDLAELNETIEAERHAAEAEIGKLKQQIALERREHEATVRGMQTLLCHLLADVLDASASPDALANAIREHGHGLDRFLKSRGEAMRSRARR